MGSEAPCGGGSYSTTLKSNNFAIFHNFNLPPSSKKMMEKFSKKSLNQENLFIYLFIFKKIIFNLYLGCESITKLMYDEIKGLILENRSL